MTIEAILLAVANAARPAGLAAVYALLSSPAPRRSLTAFIVAGFAWSYLVGVAVVRFIHGVSIDTDTGEAVIELALGVAALGFAAGLATGRSSLPRRSRQPDQESRLARVLHDPSLKVAAGAGILTHLPGLFYLLGLNAIAATEPDLAAAFAEVLAFNAIWFLPAATCLVLSVRRPERTRETLGRINAWARTYESYLVAGAFAIAGAYFALKGTLILLG